MSEPNRLINELSPYLLQHAHNPVDWFPWGEEAFEKARSGNKLIFLSIGYSTCHWCHVMEKESFEDAEIAAALNRDFVCIKVDREERPDIDAVYMAACRALGGSGGWPLTIFMTAEQKPFFAGTYFPKKPRFGQRGLLELLEAIAGLWKTDQSALADTGEQVAELLARDAELLARDTGRDTPNGYSPGKAPAEEAEARLERHYDAAWGGFGNAPKFPSPHNLLFLMHCHRLNIGGRPLAMAEHTLRAMYQGGIFDHVGGGFSRYSTDEKWLAPHFEKMLYDNALLAMAYAEAFQITGNSLYRGITEKILKYVRREMTSPEGGFYSAQDADSEGEEGKYYTFTPNEIVQILGEKDGKAFCGRYGISVPGNFEGKSIPNLIGREAALPDAHTENMLEKLYSYRAQRYPLHKDDKSLTAWNALMTAAYAKAGRIFGNKNYLEAAEKAYGFINRHLAEPDGSLRFTFRNSLSQGRGLLDDYVFLAWACLELHEASLEPACLERAKALMNRVLAEFASPSGGLYMTPVNGEQLLFSPEQYYDGAMPSGNSAAAWCMARLAALTGEKHWREAAARQLAGFDIWFEREPAAATFALSALLQTLHP